MMVEVLALKIVVAQRGSYVYTTLGPQITLTYLLGAQGLLGAKLTYYSPIEVERVIYVS